MASAEGAGASRGATTVARSGLTHHRIIERNAVSPIVFVGDSITASFPCGDLLPDYPIVNKGIFGDRSDLVLDRLESDVINLSPSAVFLLIGTNDIAFGATNDRYLVNCERIILRLQKGISGVKIFIQSIMPTRGLENRPIERIQLLNLELHKLALRYGIKYLDIFPLFLNEKGEMAERYSDDGLHLTAGGYHRWAAYLSDILATMAGGV